MKEQIKGLDKLLDKLDELNKMQQDKALELGLARGGAQAVKRAQEIVPVWEGKLHDNLHVGGHTELTPGYRQIGIYDELKKPGGRGKSRWVLVGTKLPHAHLVEMGSVNNRPTRFLLRGVQESEKAIVEEVDTAIQEIIDR